MPGENVVLLVTDGAPNCNGRLDPNTCRCTAPYPEECLEWSDPYNCLDDEAAVNAVRALRTGGIRTFVIGYDTGRFADVMDRMAAEGGTGHTTHFPVSSGAALEGALRDIGGSVVPCRYELDRAPGDVRFVRVLVDGATLDHTSVWGDGGGWALEGDRTVVLLGESCASVQDGAAHTVEVIVECEPVIF
jgi:hypothetical protein